MSTTTPRLAAVQVERKLGFRPEESVVIACLHHDQPDGMVARVDLAALTDPAQRADMLTQLALPLRTAAPDAVLVIYYTRGDLGSLGAIDTDLTAALAELGIPRVGSHVVDDPAPDGSTRDHLGVIPAAPPSRQRHATAALLAAQHVTLQVYLDAFARVRDGQTIPAELVGHVAAWINESTRSRDAALLLATGTSLADVRLVADGQTGETTDRIAGQAMDRLFSPATGQRPTPETRAHVTVLTEVVACTPRLYHAPARTLLAVLAWWSGNTALADRHLTEALMVHPLYRLAMLMEEVLRDSIPPGWVHTR
ncbi:DUF4192 domain-containing protein [Georgenia muralis]